MAGDSDAARSLRSKKDVKDLETNKFNFDIQEFDICPSQNLKLVSLGKSQNKAVSKNLDDLEEKWSAKKDALFDLGGKTQKISSMILDIKKRQLDVLNPEACDDMLPDSLYSSFHKHMYKQESRMLEMDVVESEAEAERLHLLRDKLDMIHWPIALRQVTVVNDPNDGDEMSRKRELTKQCIDSMLEKFEAMKTRSHMLSRNYKRNRIDPSKDLTALYNQVDRRQVINYHSSTDEEEENLSAAQIKTHRRRRRQEQCRGSIIIQLTVNPQAQNTRYAIIAEPLRKPYVVKASQTERNLWKSKMKGAPKKFDYCPHLADQVAVFQRKVSIPLNLAHSKSTLEAITTISSAKNANNAIKRKASFISRNVSNGLEATDENLESFRNRIHSPPIRKRRTKQD